MRRAFDIVVIGGGVIGRAVAFEMAVRRAGRVGLVDHGSLGGEASPAAAGFLPVASMRAPRGILFDLARTGLALYPDFLGSLRAFAGTAPVLETPGCVQFAASGEEAATLRHRVDQRRSQGLAAEFLERPELRALLPGASDAFAAAALFASEHKIDVPALLAALARAGDRLGVQRSCARAAFDSTEARRVTALRVGAETWTLGSIVLAAGWWTAELARALGVTLPLRPARGEMIEVALDSAGPPHVLEHGAVMVPRIGGRMGVGGLVEFDAAPEPTARGLAALLDRAAEVWPGVRSAPVVAHWAGVRPCSVLRHPIVDRVPGWENAYVATGHHRSGFLLAPLTAKVVAARLLGERLPVPEQAVRWA